MRSTGRATFRVDCGTAILEELRLGRHVDVLVTYAAVQRQHPYLVHVGIAVPDEYPVLMSTSNRTRVRLLIVVPWTGCLPEISGFGRALVLVRPRL